MRAASAQLARHGSRAALKGGAPPPPRAVWGARASPPARWAGHLLPGIRWRCLVAPIAGQRRGVGAALEALRRDVARGISRPPPASALGRARMRRRAPSPPRFGPAPPEPRRIAELLLFIEVAGSSSISQVGHAGVGHVGLHRGPPRPIQGSAPTPPADRFRNIGRPRRRTAGCLPRPKATGTKRLWGVAGRPG